MRYFLCFSFLLCTCVLAAQTAGFHRAKIYYEEVAQLTRLAEMGVGIDHGRNKANYSFESDFTAEELALVAAAGMNFEITIKDVDQFYLHRNQPGHPDYVAAGTTKNADCATDATAEIVAPANYNEGSMGGFLTYPELLAELDEMYAFCQANGLDIMTPRAELTDPAAPDDLKTAEGRYLQWVKFSDDAATDDDTEPEILYDALHHAREPAAMQQLVFYMWYLLENYATSDEVKSIIDNAELYFIPCVNPDGYLYNEQIRPNGGGLWRKNRRGGYGVDLNRNYDYVTPAGESIWNTTGTSEQLSGETFPGSAPFSEPETRALRYFVEQHDFTIALNNHTSGRLLLYPFGYDLEKPTPDQNYFELLSGAMVRDNDYANIISSALYPVSGDSDDWMYGFLTTRDGGARDKVFAMTPEIGPEFWPARSRIDGILKDMLVHNLTAAHALNNYVAVEETSPGIMAGRSPEIKFNLTQIGLRPGPVTVRIVAVSDNIIGVPAPAVYDLGPEEQGAGTLVLSLFDGIGQGDVFTFDLVVDNGTFTQTKRVTKTYGDLQTEVADPADDLATWTTSGDWGTTTATFFPGSPSASITDSPGESYASNVNSTITLSGPVDLTDVNLQTAYLRFHARWDIEADYDQTQVQVSTDGGANWTAQCGRYTHPGTDNHFTPNEPVYDGTQNDWVLEEINLSDYLGETINVRFQFRSDGGVEEDGFYFDALSVDFVRRPLVGAIQPLTTPVSIQPNPVSDQLRIVTGLADYAYELTHIGGQRLRNGWGRRGVANINVAELPAGIYLLTLRAAGKERTLRVVKGNE